MTPRFQSTVTIETFKEDFRDLGEQWLEREPGRYLSIVGSRATFHPGSAHWPMSGPIYELKKIDGHWYFTGDYVWSLD